MNEAKNQFEQCCQNKLNIVAVVDGQSPVPNDSLVYEATCAQCGTRYTLVYDLAMIEKTDLQETVWGQ